MFKGLGNIQQLMQQAQQMNKKMTAMRKELDDKQASASVGGGAVEVTVNGKLEIVAVRIDPSVVKDGDVQMLQDLVTTGVNQALGKMQKTIQDAMSSITGGMSLPGLGF